MKKVLFAISLLLIATACKKSDESATVEPPLEPIAAISLLEPKPPSGPVLLQGDAKANLLGYGYDVTGKVDDASSARAVVLDMASFMRDKTIEASNASSYSMNSRDAENAEELALRLSTAFKETEGRKLYGQSISSFFPDGQPFADKYVYGFYSDVLQYKQLKFFVHRTIADYLTAEFKADLQTLDAAALVKKYGTHMLSNISLGGRLNIIYQAETMATNRSQVQKAGYDVALNTIFGRWSGRLEPVDSTLLRTIKTPRVAFDVVGGDPSKIQILKTATGPRVDFSEWSKTITTKNSVFIRVIEMAPLTKLIDNAVKKAEVESYITAYLAANEVKTTK